MIYSFIRQGIGPGDVTSETNTTQGADTKEEKNTDSEDDDWWSDLGPDFSVYPRPRTAHAATVVGNELIIHGGMGGNEHTDEWDGSTSWESLGDMWVFDLNTREWTRRWLFPLLVRSYHSLVGWSVSDDMMGWGGKFENDTSWEGPIVAVFGGYTPGLDDFSGAVSVLLPGLWNIFCSTLLTPNALYCHVGGCICLRRFARFILTIERDVLR